MGAVILAGSSPTDGRPLTSLVVNTMVGLIKTNTSIAWRIAGLRNEALGGYAASQCISSGREWFDQNIEGDTPFSKLAGANGRYEDYSVARYISRRLRALRNVFVPLRLTMYG
jgi:hypothetical protein